MLISFCLIILTLLILIPYFVRYEIKWLLKLEEYKDVNLEPLDTKSLNKELEPFGFAYDPYHDIFYSILYPWQRDFGYGKIYDDASPFLSMIFDYEKIYFEYANMMWLIELWKGQYGMTTGGEIGIYKTAITDDYEDIIFDCINDNELLPMHFILKKDNSPIILRDDLHWWLTGFKLGEFTNPSNLKMEINITFRDNEMLNSFVTALNKIDYNELKISNNSVSLTFDRPHKKNFRPRLTSYIMQSLNKEYCNIYNKLTKNFTNSLDKINYIRSHFPGLYNKMLEIMKSNQRNRHGGKII
jgi:hypothetical protein